MLKTAVILAGGKGTRLQPYTIALPKPLVPLIDKPILEIIIIQLSKQGFEKVIITVNHQADIIMAYFGNGSKWGLNIEYSLENKPLGTMGPLKLINNLPDNFLVMNGDVLSDMEYAIFLEKHEKSKKIFSIACFQRKQKNDYGVLKVKNGNLVGFKEKPVTNFTVSMGIYAVSNRIIDFIPQDEYFGFDMLMLKLLGKKVDVGVYSHEGYWMDIGRPDDYIQTIEDMKTGKFKY